MLNVNRIKTLKWTMLIVQTLILLGLSTNGFAKESLLVFAAIGARQPLMEIADRFEVEFDSKIIYDFGGTGRLANKVFIGQQPDIFIAGSEKWVRILKDKQYVDDYYPIAQHTPVMIVNKKHDKIQTIYDIVQKKYKVALGDSKACAIGATTIQILKNFEVSLDQINLCAYGATVKQLVFWVESGAADFSIVWNADAVQSGKVNIIEIPEVFNAPSFIPICLMNVSQKKETALEFMSYVLDSGKVIFEAHGFIRM